MAKMGLGKGLDLLIPKDNSPKESTTAEKSIKTDKIDEVSPQIDVNEISAEINEETSLPSVMEVKEDADDSAALDDGENIVTLRISKVEPNKDQSRKTFDETSLNELAESIKQYGVIQPIVVCRKDDYYEIIAGERRWRAAKKAGLSEIPVVIRNYEDKERAEVSLIENIQRENLNPIEEAAAYKQLIDEYDLTQENLAERISKSRTAVANTMRLLKLNEKVQKMVINGELSGGHARALLGIEDADGQLKAAKKVVDNNLNVRQTEDLVKELMKPRKGQTKKKTKAAVTASSFKDIEDRMTEVLGTKVRIYHKDKGDGKIEINYFSEFELDRIYKLINSAEE